MLVGHSDAVNAVAVSVTNKSQVISGSKDCNLILWDLHTGEEIHTLAGHLAPVTCVRVSADGEKKNDFFYFFSFTSLDIKVRDCFLMRYHICPSISLLLLLLFYDS